MLLFYILLTLIYCIYMYWCLCQISFNTSYYQFTSLPLLYLIYYTFTYHFYHFKIRFLIAATQFLIKTYQRNIDLRNFTLRYHCIIIIHCTFDFESHSNYVEIAIISPWLLPITREFVVSIIQNCSSKTIVIFQASHRSC